MTQAKTNPSPKEEQASQTSESKTSSTKTPPKKKAVSPPTVQELADNIRDALSGNIEFYRDLIKLLGVKEPIPPEVIPEEYDLIMLYDIRIVGADGDIVRLKGRNDFPESLHPDSLSTTMLKFQQAFTSSVGEPLGIKLMRHTTNLALKYKDEQQVPNLQLPPPRVTTTSRDDKEKTDDGFITEDLP